jgi:type IV pilus assembly protein PilW
MSARLPIRPPCTRTRLRGLGLVELMLAMALGLVVIAALGQLYNGSLKSHQVSYTMAQIGENGRFAVDFLSTELRMAGYLSCGGSGARVGNSVNGHGHWLYRSDGIEGFEGGVDQLPDEVYGQVKPGTDALIMRRAAIDLERSLVDDDSGNAVLDLGASHGFQLGEILVVSDPGCSQVAMFQVTGLLNRANPGNTQSSDAVEHGAGDEVGPGNCTGNLYGSFDCTSPDSSELGDFRPGSAVSRFTAALYYVTDTDPPTLSRKRLSHRDGHATLVTDELIRNVENLQIQYGLDTDHDGAQTVDTYVTANQVTDWRRVLSVRFGILLRSRDPAVRAEAQSEPFVLADPLHPVASPNDRYLRRAFGSVVALRNNLP